MNKIKLNNSVKKTYVPIDVPIVHDNMDKLNKLNNFDNSNNMLKEIEIIDKILNLFPEMKKNRDFILTEILTPNKTQDNEFVFNKITINNDSYYIDKYKCIMNQNIELVGVWEYTNGIVKYHFFNDDHVSKIAKKYNDVIFNLI